MRKLLPALLVLAGCQSAYYATMEKFGVEKRSILVDRVEDAREQQAETQQQFQTTYEAFQALTGFQGGDLEKLYKKLKSEYEDAVDEAEAVGKRIGSIEDVGKAMFEEWEEEIGEYTDSEKQRISREQLQNTRGQLDSVVSAMRSAEATMEPILASFKDNVLFLKHNLNAQAIGSLQQTSTEIGKDIEQLIARMQASIAEADAFIGKMRQGS